MHQKRRLPALFGPLAVVIVAVLALAIWVVTANQVSIVIRHDGRDAQSTLVVQRGDDSPILIVIDPARRADGAAVTLAGVAVEHPATATGVLRVAVDHLAAGEYSLEVEVPRPTWFSASKSLELVVLPDA